LFLVASCLTIDHALRGSPNALERLARRRGPWRLFGMRPEEFRADSRQAATRNGGLRSIECEFDHLFLVEPRLTIGHALCGSQNALERLARRRGPWRLFGMRAEKFRADSRQAATIIISRE
jgi:hypothetical protein